MKLKEFKKLLKQFPDDFDVCITSYCTTTKEEIEKQIKNVKETEEIVLKDEDGSEDFFEEAPQGYENTYIEVIDDVVMGLNVDKEEKKIRFVIINELVDQYEIYDVDKIKPTSPLRLVKK